MSLVLYNHPISTCSQKVRYVLAEKRLRFDDVLVDLSKAEHLEPWYLAFNPNGVVPTLVHDDTVVMDSSVICEYLDEVFQPASLTPSEPAARAEMRAWMRYFEEVPTTAIRAPSYNKLFAKRLGALPKEDFESLTGRMPNRKHFTRKLQSDGFPEEIVMESIERLDQSFLRVESKLTDGRKFLLGDSVTLADIVLLPTIVRTVDLQMNEHLQPYPHLFQWFERLQARPSFAATYYEGSRPILPPD